MKLGCSIEDISALLLGGHGDDMVPLPRFTSVHGIPVNQLLPDSDIVECVERAKVGGGEVVKLMGTSAFYAPARCIVWPMKLRFRWVLKCDSGRLGSCIPRAYPLPA